MSNQEAGGSQELEDGSDWLVSLPVSLTEEGEEEEESSWSQDGGLALHLDRRWVAWHQFMREHAHLDAWLRLAEQAARSCSSTHVTYDMGKEELRRVERLQYEAALRLVELDGLTNQNRFLGRVFDGAVRSRLLAMTRDAGLRWDDVAMALDVHAQALQSMVSEREEFEAEGAELGLWLADLDARLSELENQTGNSCSKMKELQSFQACVCVSSQRVGLLMERGEAMMQSCTAPDAREVESRLLHLMDRCSHTFSRITHTHTRLLSMRLVFEDDCILSHAPDSGCPSESLLDEEGALDKPLLDCPSSTLLSAELELDHDNTSCRDPTHEHLGLEWDPSVDIGRSVAHGDKDSYFSTNTGVCSGLLSLSRGEGPRRPQRPGFPGSRSDVIDDITNQEVDSVREPISFDRGRVRAWLGVQSAAPSQKTSCSRGVQTDSRSPSRRHDNDPLCGDTLTSGPTHPHVLRSPDPRMPHRDWVRYHCQSNIQSKEDRLWSDDTQDATTHTHQCSRHRGLSSLLVPTLPYLLLAVALTLLACLLWGLLETPCHRANRFPLGHLALTYVNGPPPT